MKKIAVIRKCKKGDAEEGKPWCLYMHDGSKLLGRHPSKESAEKQEAAIKAQGRLSTVYKVLNLKADDGYRSLKHQMEERYGEYPEDFEPITPDPDNDYIDGIQEVLMENVGIDAFVNEYVKMYFEEGVLTDEDWKYINEEASKIFERPIEIDNCDELKMLMEQGDEGHDVKSTVVDLIAYNIVKDKKNKAWLDDWLDILYGD